ncbi:MAG: glycoside hydrolase family 3 C-terminal domain-containing protein [Carnobacterium sp.]|uniref:beta-glucosidase n=1 Tax=Carnobacterium sp. TaxID=48221 RepID=UPI00331612B6
MMPTIKQIVEEKLRNMTIDEKIGLLSTTQSAVERLGIQEYQIGGEAAHGVVSREGIKTTSFPQPLGLSQTWNPELLKEVGTAIGNEARILYLQSGKKSWLTLWAPTIDMERDPRWGRNEEAYGEDPYLTGRLSVGLIQGMQGEKEDSIRLAAAPKHFYGNNNEWLRESSSNSIDPRNRQEYYLKAFEPVFTKARAQSMMTAYNGVNGVPGMQLEEIEEVVRDKWKMNGFIVSDGGALSLNVDEYHYYDTYAEALADALNKGIDCFVDDKKLIESAAKKALHTGLISEQDITKAIERILIVRTKLGHFSEHFEYDDVNMHLLAGEEHNQLVKRVTAEQVVLLKNNGLLPLNKDQKLLVTGPLSEVFLRDWYGGFPPHESTIKEGLENKIENHKISYVRPHNEGELRIGQKPLGIEDETLKVKSIGTSFSLERWGYGSHVFKEKESGRYLTYVEEDNCYVLSKTDLHDWFIKENWISTDETNWQTWDFQPVGLINNEYIGVAENSQSIAFIETYDAIDSAVEKAKEVDVCVIAIGNHPMLNGKETIDRAGTEIPDQQLELVQRVYEVNPAIVLIIVGSYPFEMTWLKKHIPAILFTTHGSQELGNTIADILYQDAAPTGKLSQSWYEDINALPAITDYDVIKGERTYRYTHQKTLFPFGYGLTYGKLTIQSAELSSVEWTKKEPVKLTLTLSNSSDYKVTETVQCYVKLAPKQQIKLPKKQLVSFKKIKLEANESKTVILMIQPEDLCFWDVAWNQWVYPTANGVLQVGFSSMDQQHVLSFKAKGEVRTDRSFKEPVHAERYDDYHKAFITVNSAREKILMIKVDGWIAFKNVLFEQNPAKLRIHYSAQNEGQLSIYADKERKVKIGSQKFKAEDSGQLTIAVQNHTKYFLYICASSAIGLQTIQESSE